MTNLAQVPVSTVCILIAELCSIGVMQLLYWYAGVEALFFLPLLHGISPRAQMAEKYTFLRLLQGRTSCPRAGSREVLLDRFRTAEKRTFLGHLPLSTCREMVRRPFFRMERVGAESLSTCGDVV